MILCKAALARKVAFAKSGTSPLTYGLKLPCLVQALSKFGDKVVKTAIFTVLA